MALICLNILNSGEWNLVKLTQIDLFEPTFAEHMMARQFGMMRFPSEWKNTTCLKPPTRCLISQISNFFKAGIDSTTRPSKNATWPALWLFLEPRSMEFWLGDLPGKHTFKKKIPMQYVYACVYIYIYIVDHALCIGYVNSVYPKT